MSSNNKEEFDRFMNSLLEREEVKEYMDDIKAADEKLYEHSIMVAKWSVKIAEYLNLSEVEIIEIGVGALIHDYGLTLINIEYMNAEQDEFTPEQMFEYKKHTLYGMEKIDTDLRISNEAKKIMLFHHEKNDKSGYPFQQSPMELNSIGLQIVSVVDSYANRLYGVGHVIQPKDVALNYVRINRDKFFVSKIIDVFLLVLEEEK